MASSAASTNDAISALDGGRVGTFRVIADGTGGAVAANAEPAAINKPMITRPRAGDRRVE
ncbi:MAG: hypothetical protein CMJ51_04470 [Planctomycetaceae bacterium]|nr:hypothetical protein [Planctomycetaceae bacterium]